MANSEINTLNNNNMSRLRASQDAMKQSSDEAFMSNGSQQERYPIAGEAYWQRAVIDRSRQEEEARIAEDQQIYDSIMGLKQQGDERRAKMERIRNITNAAAFMSTDENGGMLPSDLRESLSSALGQPIYGGVNLPDGGFAYLGPSQTEQGKIGIVGRVDAATRLKILQDANLGDRTLGQQKALWGMLSQKYTPQQLETSGLHNPDRPYVVGQTTDGKMTSYLFGRGAPRNSRISFFASDGQGGGMRSYYDGFTGERTEEDLGNWAQYDKDRDAERLAKVAYAKSGGRMDIEQMKEQGRNERQVKDLEGRENRIGKYIDQRDRKLVIGRIATIEKYLNDPAISEDKKKEYRDELAQWKEMDGRMSPRAEGSEDGKNEKPGTPDAILGRQPVLGQKPYNGSDQNDGLSANPASGIRSGEIEVENKSSADKAVKDGGTYRIVVEGNKIHYYVTPAKKVKPKPVNEVVPEIKEDEEKVEDSNKSGKKYVDKGKIRVYM